MRGTLEGAIVCDCPDRPPRTCIELAALPVGSGPNPRIEQGVSFEVLDHTGAPFPTTEIRPQGSFIGLDAGRTHRASSCPSPAPPSRRRSSTSPSP